MKQFGRIHDLSPPPLDTRLELLMGMQKVSCRRGSLGLDIHGQQPQIHPLAGNAYLYSDCQLMSCEDSS